MIKTVSLYHAFRLRSLLNKFLIAPSMQHFRRCSHLTRDVT